MEPTDITTAMEPAALLRTITEARTTNAIEVLLKKLPIADEQSYLYNEKDPNANWTKGQLHWIPLGRRRGGAGQVALAKTPVAPLAERLVNGMEALIELERQRELLSAPNSAPPTSPRDATFRYFGLPSLDLLPQSDKPIRQKAREMARRLHLDLAWDKKAKEFSIQIRDQGIGQSPARMHETLLSLGSSDKGDKPYLIGIFGQGGSSTFQASQYSWILSRRSPDILKGDGDGVGFSIIKRIFPKGRRDPYFGYLAAHPDGRVPSVPAEVAESIGLKHGSWFTHLDYEFGQAGSAITRSLYQMLNHVLYNPVLPFDTNVSGTEAPIYGNGYRLSNLKRERKDIDKVFGPQLIG